MTAALTSAETPPFLLAPPTVITLPFPPSVNGLFANKKRGRVRSERYREWANAAGWELKAQRPKRVKGPVRLSLFVQEKRDRKRDISNLVKAVEDLLVEHRIIDGDDQATVREVRASWCPRTTGCRVEVERV